MTNATKWLIAVLFLCVSSVCYAADFADIDVNAVVPDMLDLSYDIQWFMDDNPEPQGPVDDFDFGSLTHTFPDMSEAGVWFSRKWFTIYLVGMTGGQRYQLKQTCTGVTSGGDDINNSFTVTPNYSELDELIPDVPQGPMPPDAVLGDPSLAVATDHVIYSSGESGEMRLVQGIYAIPNESTIGGFESVTFDQPQGTYTGEVTFTVVLY